MFMSTILFSTFLVYGQSNNIFVLDNPPTEVCVYKFVTFKVLSNDDHECNDFNSVEWYIRSDQTRPFWGASMNQGKEFSYFPSFGTSSRTFDVKAEITCDVYKGQDQYGNPIYGLETFTATKSIKLVHPDFFQLSLVESPSCDATSYEFKLRDPSGTLDASNLDNISWTVPPNWTIVSGQTGSTMVVNTNNASTGQKKIKVKYEAIATKVVNTFPESKKCISSEEIEANIDISACRSIISYPPSIANHPSSHSASMTSFANVTLSPNNYNFASGQFLEIGDGFDFNASPNSSFHLFTEDCGCDSEWHDPNLLGQASVSYTNPVVVANKNGVTLFTEHKKSNNIRLSLYPNPFNSTLSISNLASNQLIHIRITTVAQRTLLLYQEKANNSGVVELDLSHLIPGVFIIQIKNGNEFVTRKILKL